MLSRPRLPRPPSPSASEPRRLEQALPLSPGLLLAAFALCQPPALDAELAARTRAWFEARRLREDRAPGVSDDLVALRHREAFAAWARATRDERLLRDGSRLADLFRRGMDYAPLAGDGELRPWAEEAGVLVRVPERYTPGPAWPTLVAVFDPKSESGEVVAQRALALVDPDWIVVTVESQRLASFVRTPVVPRLTTGDGLRLVASALVWAVGPPALAVPLWRSTFEATVGPPAVVDERDLPRGLFALLGGVQRRLHIDRERLVLACSGAAAQVGVRVVATAPDRFAGLVLWEPGATPAGQIDNLGLIPILVVAEGPNIVATSAYSMLAEVNERTALRSWEAQGAAVRAWVRAQRRDLFRPRVAFVMEDDAIVDGFWLKIDAADFSSAPGERRAGIEAVADRATNTITVTAKHVDQFTLLLNDAIVDLDRAIVIDINGMKATLRRVRSFEFLLESVFQRFDPGYVFTTAITLAVPRRG